MTDPIPLPDRLRRAAHPRPSYTLAVIKPDAYASGLLGNIIARIQLHFSIEAMLHLTWPRSLAENFYAAHRDRPFFEDLVSFSSSGPCVALILGLPNSGTDDHAVKKWRALMGATDPKKAEEGTFRYHFGARDPDSPMMHNAVHGSDSPFAALREIELLDDYSYCAFATQRCDAFWRDNIIQAHETRKNG
jgi:nucleoside-diphosphate kinase